jgi:hypothetical protein
MTEEHIAVQGMRIGLIIAFGIMKKLLAFALA